MMFSPFPLPQECSYLVRNWAQQCRDPSATRSVNKKQYRAICKVKCFNPLVFIFQVGRDEPFWAAGSVNSQPLPWWTYSECVRNCWWPWRDLICRNLRYKKKIAISRASFTFWRSVRPVCGLRDYRSKVRGKIQSFLRGNNMNRELGGK